MFSSKKTAITLFIIAAVFISYSNAFALKVGDTVENVEIRDARNKPATIPWLGERVLLIPYTDADVADQNDPFLDIVDAEKFPAEKMKGVGIGNLKDAPWKPNSIIRLIIRGKIKKYKSTILTDVDRTMQKAWDLGDCDDKSVIILVGKDKKVYYIKKGKMNDAEHKEALQIIKNLVAKTK